MTEPTDFCWETLLAQREWVRQLARSLVRDEGGVDDLEQQTWLAVLRRRPTGLRSPRAWLGTVVRRVAGAERRTRLRRDRRERAASRPESVPPAADVVADAETHKAVVQAVLDLDEPYRSTILLRFFESLPPREVARRKEVPVETVRSQTRRGLARLRTRLAARAGAIAVLAGWPGKARAGVVAMTTKSKIVAGTALLLAAGMTLAVLHGFSGDPTHSRSSASAPTVDDDPAALEKGVADVTNASDVTVAGCRVRVVDPEGRPVADAEATAVREDGTVYSATGDATGLLVLPPESAGPVVLWAAAPQHAYTRAEPTLLKGGEIRVVLRPGGRVRLAFVDAHGLPLDVRERYERSGIEPRVRLLPQAALARWQRAAYWLLPRAEAAWQGRLAWEWRADGAELARPLAAGPWRLFVPRPQAVGHLCEVFTVEAGGVTTVRVPVPEARTRRVRFVRADDHQPLPATGGRACLALDDRRHLRGRSFVADERGELDLPFDPSADALFTWWFAADGWAGSCNNRMLAQASASPLEIELARTWAVRGVAYRADGGPARRKTLFCRQESRLLVAQTDDRGRFRVEGLARDARTLRADLVLLESSDPPRTAERRLHGQPWQFTEAGRRVPSLRRKVVEAAHAARRAPEDEVLARRHRELLGQLQRTQAEARRAPAPDVVDVHVGEPGQGVFARVEGRITTGGHPLAGAHIQVGTEQAWVCAVTGRDGSFTVPRVPGDRCNVYVRWGIPSRFGRPHLLRGDELSLTPGETTRIDLDLPGGEARVAVVDAQTGAPIPRAYVFGGPEGLESQAARFEGFYFLAGWTAVTDDEGEARLRGLVTGDPHVLTAGADGYEAAMVRDVRPGSADQPARWTVRLSRKGE